jgi:hypothetical protein
MTYLSVATFDNFDLSDFKICLKKIVLKSLANGDQTIELPALTEYDLQPSGLDLTAVNLPRGDYQGGSLLLESSCGAGNSILVTNLNGSFNSQSSITLTFEGEFSIDNAHLRVNFWVQPIAENLNTVADNASVAIAATQDSGVTAVGSLVKRMFITPASIAGGIVFGGGLSVADGTCQNIANGPAKLYGNWRALMSDDVTDARDRILDVGPWYLVDNVTLVTPNLASLWSGNLVNPISTDQYGRTYTDNIAWTGTNPDGTRRTGETCQGTATVGAVGNSNRTDAGWVYDSTINCSTLHPFYCIEQ